MVKKVNKYIFKKSYIIGITSNTKRKFYIDIEDYDKIKDYCWRESDGYIITNKNRATLKLHRIIMGVTNKRDFVDHVNHNKRDNRKINLRICNAQENARNCLISKNNTSGCKGVSYDKRRKKWTAEICINYKIIHLGRFNTIEEAIETRKKNAKKIFGEYANE